MKAGSIKVEKKKTKATEKYAGVFNRGNFCVFCVTFSSIYQRNANSDAKHFGFNGIGFDWIDQMCSENSCMFQTTLFLSEFLVF